jgi:hypothetical protein
MHHTPDSMTIFGLDSLLKHKFLMLAYPIEGNTGTLNHKKTKQQAHTDGVFKTQSNDYGSFLLQKLAQGLSVL